MFALPNSCPCYYLIYNGLICDRLKFKCVKCKKEKDVDWRYFFKKKHINYCAKCVPSIQTVRDSIAKTVKSSINKEEISQKTKEAMKNHDVIDRMMLGVRQHRLDHISNIQQDTTDYIYKKIKQYQLLNGLSPCINYIKEYPLPFYRDDLSYRIIDICFPQYKVAIEIMGEFWHKAWIEHIRDGISIDVLRETYKNNKQHSYRLNVDYLFDKISKELGWHVLYITENEVMDNSYKATLDSFIQSHKLWKLPLSECDKQYL